MTEKLVTIATYSDPIEANLAKLKLASEDIDCFLTGEHTAYTGVLCEIKLQVRQYDAEFAVEVLNRPPDETEPQDFYDEDPDEESPDEF